MTASVMMKPVEPLRFHRFAGQQIVDLPLPGDEYLLLEHRIKLSIMRDNRLNTQEHRVYMCELIKFRYGTRVCLAIGCEWCGGDGWSRREYGQLDLFDRWP